MDRGTNFAVFSENAGKMQLCLFDDSGKNETRFELPECTNGIWHGYLPNARPGTQYGYRAYGEYKPLAGHRFNPHKLLFDPYARKIAGEVKWSDALHGYRLVSPKADLSLDRRDSAFAMPKGVVTEEHFDWGDDRPPRTPWSDTIIYEVQSAWPHANLRKDLPERDRGNLRCARSCPHCGVFEKVSASPLWSCCRSTLSSMTGAWSKPA